MKREKCQALVEEFRSILKKYKIEEQSLCQSVKDDAKSQSSNDSFVN